MWGCSEISGHDSVARSASERVQTKEKTRRYDVQCAVGHLMSVKGRYRRRDERKKTVSEETTERRKPRRKQFGGDKKRVCVLSLEVILSHEKKTHPCLLRSEAHDLLNEWTGSQKQTPPWISNTSCCAYYYMSLCGACGIWSICLGFTGKKSHMQWFSSSLSHLLNILIGARLPIGRQSHILGSRQYIMYVMYFFPPSGLSEPPKLRHMCRLFKRR